MPQKKMWLKEMVAKVNIARRLEETDGRVITGEELDRWKSKYQKRKEDRWKGIY